MINRSTLMRQLEQLGLRGRSPLMVHASMRKTGPIDGGAETLIDALLDTIGADGTVLMMLGPIEEMGVLADVFRRRRGVVLNDHVACKYAAFGKDAQALVEPTPLNDYHGRGSPLERLVEMGGHVLRLGADPDTVTLTHYAEYLANLPKKKRVKRSYGDVEIESLDDDKGIVEWKFGDYFPQIFIDFMRTGRAKMGPVGNGMAEAFSAKVFVDFAVAWMEKNLR